MDENATIAPDVLEACRACGSSGAPALIENGYGWRVVCTTCGASTPCYMETWLAVDAWNRTSASPF
jgi:hypothetical protein